MSDRNSNSPADKSGRNSKSPNDKSDRNRKTPNDKSGRDSKSPGSKSDKYGYESPTTKERKFQRDLFRAGVVNEDGGRGDRPFREATNQENNLSIEEFSRLANRASESEVLYNDTRYELYTQGDYETRKMPRRPRQADAMAAATKSKPSKSTPPKGKGEKEVDAAAGLALMMRESKISKSLGSPTGGEQEAQRQQGQQQDGQRLKPKIKINPKAAQRMANSPSKPQEPTQSQTQRPKRRTQEPSRSNFPNLHRALADTEQPEQTYAPDVYRPRRNFQAQERDTSEALPSSGPQITPEEQARRTAARQRFERNRREREEGESRRRAKRDRDAEQ